MTEQKLINKTNLLEKQIVPLTLEQQDIIYKIYGKLPLDVLIKLNLSPLTTYVYSKMFNISLNVEPKKYSKMEEEINEDYANNVIKKIFYEINKFPYLFDDTGSIKIRFYCNYKSLKIIDGVRYGVCCFLIPKDGKDRCRHHPNNIQKEFDITWTNYCKYIIIKNGTPTQTKKGLECGIFCVRGINFCPVHAKAQDDIKEEKDDDAVTKKSTECNYKDCKKFKRAGSLYCLRHKEGENFIEPVIKTKDDITNHEYREKQRGVTAKGDLSEVFVKNILDTFTIISDIVLTGPTGNKFDIIYRYNNEDFLRGLQVKTFSFSKNGYHFKIKKHYDNDTLIVAINQEDKKYFLSFVNELNGLSHIWVSFNNNDRYINNKFTDFEKFKNKLLIMLANSTIYNEETAMTKNYLMEQQSLRRLKVKMEEFNYDYKNGLTSASVYDCFINGYTIQHKSCNRKKNESHTVHITLSKNDFTLDRKRYHQPYNVKDGIDFFIFEIIDQIDNFYIVPSAALAKYGYLRDEENNVKGIEAIKFYFNTPIGSDPHWILKYYNRYNLLEKPD